MDKLPSGTVTFLFTDIEDSTRLWQEQPEAMSHAHALHDQILHEVIEANHGYVFQIVGDSFSVAFHKAIDGLKAALAAQHGLEARQNDPSLKLKARMGLHTGAAEIRTDGKYDGYVTVASCQRVMSVAHGGQVLLSHTAADLLGDLPEGVSLRDMGEHKLKSLRSSLRLYQLLAPGLPRDFPPIQSLNQFPNNIPTQLTTFIGREKEIVEVISALESARLVTLTGSGGTGKTRLSQEVGLHLLTHFPHGVWLVELAPLGDEAQIIPALAQVFSLQELPFNPMAKLVEDYLREKKLLLILDNCEHLVSACARLADQLLRQCAGLKILASSREALGIAGEIAYHTPSLGDSESTQLFLERARAANSNFKLTEANRSAVVQICRRLDGIPLAIELAAARTKLLSPEQIASRLDDMFRLLVGGSRTALPRQHTLRALIDWSYDLLSDEEKRLLQFASVFVGGWTLDALEYVADDPGTIELLEQLVNKSLVVTEEREGEMRYFMLETIRQYGREKLFEAKQAAGARDRHFYYYKNSTSGFWDATYMAGPVETQKFKSMQVEAENLRSAFEWGLQNHVQDTLDLTANIAMGMNMGGSPQEGITLLKVALEKFGELQPVEGDADHLRKEIYAHACFSLGVILQGTDEIRNSLSMLREAIVIARELEDHHMLALCLEMYANSAAMIQAEDTLTATMEGLEIFRELNDPAGLGIAYSNLARWEAVHGNFQEAENYRSLAQALRKDGTTSIGSGFLNFGMGIGARHQGYYELAYRYFEDALKVFQQIGHRGMIAVMRSEIAHTQRTQGDFAEAKRTYLETIKVFQDHGNRSAVAHQLECFAMIAIVDKEPQRAAKLFGAAGAIRDVTGHKRTDEEQEEYVQFMDRLYSMLQEAECNMLWAQGRAMTMEQAIQLALS